MRTKPIYEFCRNFDECDCNNCPLVQGKYPCDTSDPVKKCKLSACRRATIKRKYALWLLIPEGERPEEFKQRITIKMAKNTITESKCKKGKK